MEVHKLYLILTVCFGSVLSQEFNGECYVDGEPRRCEPVRMSFSLEQTATANSTCGATPSPFCVRSTSLGRISSDCSGEDICDANDPENAHPATYLTDFPLTGTWWQSENSLDPSTSVVIDIPLLTLAEITVITFDFKTIKPAGFYIEKSTDYGETYEPYHYFAVSCLSQYGIDPDAELTAMNETVVRCQTINEPPVSGVISFFPAIDRPSANDSVPGYSEALYLFATATNIRVVLDQHYELDLAQEDPGYYYALEDINVVGSCQCYGHASGCTQSTESGAYECVCKHNTTGTYCEQCQDFYQDVPWQRADGSGPFECKICNCNNHSNECVFDPVVYEQTGQTGGGVCLNCTGNTVGRQCETCAEFFYPRPDREQTDEDVCADCSCLLEGVTNNGDCAKEDNGILQPGDCYCKANVIGRACDMCALGYYNLSADNPDGCQACDCSVNGSSSQTCNHITGECECKPNVIGPQCDNCREDYYQPDPSEGCLPCDCNLGGSTDTQCDMTTGQCPCQPGVTGLTCSETVEGYFFPTTDYLRLEGENAISIPPTFLTVSSGEGELFTGTGYYRVVEEQGIANFGTLVMPVSGTYEVLFRYNLEGALTWNTATLTILAGDEEGMGPADCGGGTEVPVGDTSVQYTSWVVGTAMAISQNFCFRGGRSYSFILSETVSGQTSSPTLDIDALVAIPISAPSLAVFAEPQLVADYNSCVDSWRRVPTISSAESFCEEVTFTFSTAIYSGTLECDCDPDGSMAGTVCEPYGGQCVCLPGVRGRRCDECSPGTYNFSPTGCTSCACNPVGSTSDLCQPDAGTCDCLPNVAGPNCSSCNPNFWGLTSGVGCTECSCNEMGSQDLQCDQVTGECECKDGVMGTQCNQCQPEHYGFSDNGCSPCDCDAAGSPGQACEVVVGQCTCRDNTRTRDCSSCVSGTFNLQHTNPSGCQPCFCSGVGATCTAAPGYIAAHISTDFNSTDLNLQGWSVVSADFQPHPDPDLVVTSMPFTNGATILPNSDAYLQAPSPYLGNKLSSYVQLLTINLETLSTGIGVSTLTQHDVILSGNNLQLGIQFPTDSISDATSIEIQLHESNGWAHILTGQEATSGDLQSVLASLDNVFVTASFNSSVTLESIELDTVEETSNLNDPSSVTWVEQCDCPANYTGLSCQQCAPGYTRTPAGSCELCQCNGFSTNCDSENGACVDCTDSTTGPSCEQCLPGTYGDPMQGVSCLPCPCPLTSGAGQFTNECILTESGSVICLNCPEGHTGEQCEACSDGYFGDPTGENGEPTGCSDCLCNGNTNSSIPGSCNTTTGICILCLGNTAGNMCERCADGYYGDAIQAKNCTVCDCDPTGSRNSTCAHATGQCLCKPNVEGVFCDQCIPDHFGLSSGSGCTSCNCHPEGSRDSQCDQETGQCSCKPGVTGLHCDQCMTGFFGLSADGCEACNCSISNSILDTCDANGVCQCQPGSTGANCDICLENHFQGEEGCTECPQCYQELLALATETTSALEIKESIIFDLLVETSPYEPRLRNNQTAVQSIVDTTEDLSQHYALLQTQLEELTTAINVTLREDVMQLDATLQTLKTTSTPVFVLALSAEELMNRTIEEFLMAQESIDLLASFYIPNIQQSVSEINSSLSLSSEAVATLEAQIQQVSNETSALSELVQRLQYLASSALATAEEVDSLHTETEMTTSYLQQNVTYLEQAVNSLGPALETLAVDIAETSALIQQQRESLPSIPSTDELNSLTENVSNAQNNVAILQSEVSEENHRVLMLQQSLNNSQQEVSRLGQDITDLTSEVTDLEERTQEAYGKSSTATSSAQSRIDEAEQVVASLQSFSGESFEVARAANEALESLSEITRTANYAIQTATAIQNNVSDIVNVVEEAMQLANDAENITLQAQMDISALDTASLISNISGSLETIEESREMAMDLEEEARNYEEELENLALTLSGVDQQVRNGSVLANESETLRNQANDAIDTLTTALSQVRAINSSKLSDIQEYLNAVETEVQSANITAWYASLNQSLYEQQSIRQQLQQRLTAVQAEVSYLRHLQSILPPDCDSGL